MVIAGSSWWSTGKIDYALGGDPPVICLNADAREYGFAPGVAAHPGGDVLLLGPNLDERGVKASYGDMFDRIEPLGPAVLRFPHRPPAELPMFLAKGLRARP
jgi:hypothetical protein